MVLFDDIDDLPFRKGRGFGLVEQIIDHFIGLPAAKYQIEDQLSFGILGPQNAKTVIRFGGQEQIIAGQTLFRFFQAVQERGTADHHFFCHRIDFQIAVFFDEPYQDLVRTVF